MHICSLIETERMEKLFFFFAMTEEKDRVLPCCQHGYVDEPCRQEGFFPREENPRWLFFFVVPVFPASLALI
jgi:hypothetical protein